MAEPAGEALALESGEVMKGLRWYGVCSFCRRALSIRVAEEQ